RTEGLTCSSSKSRHGFFLSRQSQRLIGGPPSANPQRSVTDTCSHTARGTLHTNTTCSFARRVARATIRKSNAVGFDGVFSVRVRVRGVRLVCELDNGDDGLSADCQGGRFHVWFLVNR